MKNYLELLNKIMETGVNRKGRNGLTRGLFAQQLRWDLKAGFPLVTTKFVDFKLIVSELLWFLSGSTDNVDLKQLVGKDRTIWSDNFEAEAWLAKLGPVDLAAEYLGRIYGHQWRHWNQSVDQIKKLVVGLREDKFSRYHVVTAWNPSDLDMVALPCCHILFQCWVNDVGELSLGMIQRSCDMFLGVPFNIASYGLLSHILAAVTGLKVGELVIDLMDCHIYHSHFDQVKAQLGRPTWSLPELKIKTNRVDWPWEYKVDDFELLNYKHEPKIPAKMVV